MQPKDGNHAFHGPSGKPVRRRLPVRWWIVGMLFVGSVVNYLDRITLSIVAPMIRDEFGLSASDYALVVNVFLVAYTFSYGFGGKLADFLGTRASYYVTVTWWSIAACLHTLTQGLYSLCAYRFLLGLGEAGFFPTGVKAISEWFHPRDRGKPISIMLLGLGIGALLGPPVVSWLTLNVGWRAMFLITGLLGFLLLLPWTFIYRKPEEHPRLTEEEQEYLRESAKAVQDDTGQRMRVRDFLRYRGVWTLLGARSLADGTWYFYLFWMPEYLMRERGFSMEMIGGLLWIPFLASDLGLLLGRLAFHLSHPAQSRNPKNPEGLHVGRHLGGPAGNPGQLRFQSVHDHSADVRRLLRLRHLVRECPDRGHRHDGSPFRGHLVRHGGMRRHHRRRRRSEPDRPFHRPPALQPRVLVDRHASACGRPAHAHGADPEAKTPGWERFFRNGSRVDGLRTSR